VGGGGGGGGVCLPQAGGIIESTATESDGKEKIKKKNGYSQGPS